MPQSPAHGAALTAGTRAELAGEGADYRVPWHSTGPARAAAWQALSALRPTLGTSYAAPPTSSCLFCSMRQADTYEDLTSFRCLGALLSRCWYVMPSAY